MSYRPEIIWIDQAAAAEGIYHQFGATDALSYLVGEKFLSFLSAATTHPEFEAEVPAFARRIQEIFEPHELRAFLDQPGDPDRSLDVDEADTFDLIQGAERILLIDRAKELLLE